MSTVTESTTSETAPPKMETQHKGIKTVRVKSPQSRLGGSLLDRTPPPGPKPPAALTTEPKLPSEVNTASFVVDTYKEPGS